MDEKERKFLDLLPDGVMLLDGKGRVLYANPALSRLLGKPLSEIKGALCCELVHGTKEPPSFCICPKVLQTGKPQTEEFFEPHLKAWLWAYAAPLKDEAGKIVGCFHLIRNLSAEKENLFGRHLLEKLIETLPSFFYLSDSNYQIRMANERFKAWVGFDPVGHKCYEAIYGLNEPCPWCHRKEVFEKGETVAWEARSPKDGRWYWAINAPFDSPTGERFKISLLFDITERKRLEEELNQLFEGLPVGVFITGWDGTLHRANKALKQFLGVPENTEVTRLKTTDFYVHPEDRKNFLAELEKKGEVQDYEVQLKDFRGRKFWAGITARLIEAEGRKLIWGTLQDISLRKKAEQALLESETRFRALAENAPLGIILMNERGRIIYFNPAAEKIFGYKAEEVYGKDLHLTLAPPEYHERYLAALRRTQETGQSRLAGRRREFEARRKDGTLFPAEVFFSVIDLPDKRFYLGLVQDLTEVKKIEAERLRLEKHRALELLAGGIAHDFNNLLASLLGNLELAQGLARNPKVKEILSRAEKVAGKARDLARDLLIFSKGDVPIPKKVALQDTLADLARFLLHGSAVKLRLEIPEDLPPVKMDPTHLAQVLQNLILNAKEAMSAGGELLIRAERIGDQISLIVKDTGPGIPEDILPRIFEPGFTTKPAGTGLGLPVVKSVVERYGGEVSVQSFPGQGTTFKLLLPIGKPEKEKPPEKETVSRRKTFSGKVLVMDDEEPIRVLLREALSLKGLEVETAEDGEEALQKYQKALEEGRPFDLVILDLTVPGGKGGLWTIEQLRKIHPQVKAVLSSGYSLDDTRKIMAEFPFVDFLRKPYTLDELSRLLEKHLPGNDS